MSRDFNLPPAGSNMPNRADVPTQVDPDLWASLFGSVPQIAGHATGPIASVTCSTIPDHRELLRQRLMADLMHAIQRPTKRSGGDSAFQAFVKACQEFLDHGFDLNIKSEDGRLPLVRAIRYGTLAMVKHLIAKGAKLGEEDGWRRTAFTAGLIVDTDDDTIFDFIIAQLPPDKVASMSCEALYVAAREGYSNAVSRLLKRGTPFEYRNALGMNAAHIAAAYGRVEVLGWIRLADRRYHEMRDNQRRTPLHHAVPQRSDLDGLKKRKIAILELMLKDRGGLRYALETSRQDNDARTALHLAVIEGSVEAVEQLKEWHTVVIADNFGKLPLHYALESGALDIVKVLLSCGNPKEQTNFKLFRSRPVDIAKKNQQHDVLRLFAEYKERYKQMPPTHVPVMVASRPERPAPGAAEPPTRW